MRTKHYFPIISVLSYLAFVACGIWAGVEFIIYLFKDDPFNWWSLWLTIIFFVLMVVTMIIAAASHSIASKKRFWK